MAPATTSRPAGGLRFVMDPAATGRADPETRKLIRRHVMLGKNTGKVRPPRNPAPCSPKAEGAPRRPAADGGATGGCRDAIMAVRSHGDAGDPACGGPWVRCVGDVTVPPAFGHVLEALTLPPDVQLRSVALFLQFYQQISLPNAFPLHACLSFEKTARTYIVPIVADPAYLHSAISGAARAWQAVLPPDSRCRAEMGQLSRVHAARAVTALRRRLDEAEERVRLSTSTIMCAMMLAWHCITTGDNASARVHTEGLGRLVMLRGGVRSFWPSPRPLLEIMRCDLAVAIATGLPAVLPESCPGEEDMYLEYPDLTHMLKLRDPAAGGLFLTSGGAPTPPPPPPPTDLAIDDPELGRLWREMSDFCAVVDLSAASQGRHRITSQLYMRCVAAYMYRLVDTRLAPGTPDEALRLGMLAFAAFCLLPWGALDVRYDHLAARLRRELARPALAWLLPPPALVWLLVTAGVAVLDLDLDEGGLLRATLADNLGYCGIGSWDEARALLRGFLWIGSVQDQKARSILSW